MNAFGKRNGLSGGSASRPNFGVARPMKSGPGGGDSDSDAHLKHGG